MLGGLFGSVFGAPMYYGDAEARRQADLQRSLHLQMMQHQTAYPDAMLRAALARRPAKRANCDGCGAPVRRALRACDYCGRE